MNPWILIGFFSAFAFWLRTAPRFHQVFATPGFTNFTETDAWFHVRIIEHFARHFPHRLTVDPYGRIDGGQTVDTGFFFDAPLAFIAWAGNLSTTQIHQLAAWYPAVLGILLIPATFLCGRAIFNQKAGLWAAAAVATIPGHFLHTGSLGFTDHHVMEALLTTLLLWLLTREPATSPLWLGAVLTAYLLTFAGGAFVVAIVMCWYWLESARGLETPANSRNFAWACLIALPFTLWQVHVYFMRYSVAAVLIAAAALFVLPAFTQWCRSQSRPRAWFLAVSALAACLTVAVLSLALPRGESLFSVLGRMVATGDLAPTVGELQSLTGTKGYFSLEEAWNQFGGAFIFAIAALPVLAEAVWRRPNPKHSLFLLWALVLFVMTIGQVRMTYYFGVSAGLLAGFIMGHLQARQFVIAALGVVLLVPNLVTAVNDTARLAGQVTPDWREALTYLRERTPEPFGDPQAYLNTPNRPPAYSVLSWWDYGYWITTIAHRVPVTNPTQNNVSAAVDFLLATDTQAARDALTKSRAAYVVLDARLPLTSDQHTIRGFFLSFFPYARHHRRSDYVWDVRETNEAGRAGRTLFFRASYFRTMLFRLYFAGGEAKAAQDIGNFAVIVLNGDRLEKKDQFTSLAAARAAASQCANCELVSENPLTSFVDVEAVPLMEQAFVSSSTAVRWHESRRPEVQIYKLR